MKRWMIDAILIGALLACIVQLIEIRIQTARIQSMMYDLDTEITRGAMTGKVGERVQ